MVDRGSHGAQVRARVEVDDDVELPGPVGELRVGIATRATLEPLRPSAPKNWSHGFIQQSHSLEPADFDAIRRAFESGLRADRGMAGRVGVGTR